MNWVAISVFFYSFWLNLKRKCHKKMYVDTAKKEKNNIEIFKCFAITLEIS